MIGKRRVAESDPGSLTRRRWLAGALLGGLAIAARAEEPGGGSADDLAEIQARAGKAGIGPFRSSETEHYLGIGNAPDDHRNQALRICEELATVYQKHFQSKGFTVELPKRRLTVVTLKDLASYAAYLGEDPGPVEGGHFDLDTDRLVIFDFLSKAANLAAAAARVNTFTLVHEALHQLTFNTGLLNLKGDVPTAISEGLAAYGELWQRRPRPITLGGANIQRLRVFVQHPDQAGEWIPLATLLTDDELFANEEKQQLAYAQSWALVHYLMKTATALPKFRAYLAAIRERRDAGKRIADVEASLGPIEVLDRAVRKHAVSEVRTNRPLLGT
jgi:hypothetical protein